MIGLVVNLTMYFVAKFEFYLVIKQDFIWPFPAKKTTELSTVHDIDLR